jgi:hypothetical protein
MCSSDLAASVFLLCLCAVSVPPAAGLGIEPAGFLTDQDPPSLWDPGRLWRNPGLIARDLEHAGRTFFSDAVHIHTAPLRLNARSALWLGGIAAAWGLLYAYDQEIYDALQRNRDHRLYKPFRKIGEAISPAGHMGKTNRYYFGALGVSYIVGFQPGIHLFADILEAHFMTGGGKNLAVALVGRRRPHEEMGPRSYAPGEGTSFPSGHAINILELATILSRHVRFLPFQITCYGLAVAVCFERVTDDQHWPSDVFAGAVFGAVVADALLDLRIGRGVDVRPGITGQGSGLGLGFSCTF